MESYYDSDEEVAWGPLTLKEVKKYVTGSPRKIVRRHSDSDFNPTLVKMPFEYHHTIDINNSNSKEKANESDTSKSEYYSANDETTQNPDNNVQEFLKKMEQVIEEKKQQAVIVPKLKINDSTLIDKSFSGPSNIRPSDRIDNIHLTLVENTIHLSSDDDDDDDKQYIVRKKFCSKTSTISEEEIEVISIEESDDEDDNKTDNLEENSLLSLSQLTKDSLADESNLNSSYLSTNKTNYTQNQSLAVKIEPIFSDDSLNSSKQIGNISKLIENISLSPSSPILSYNVTKDRGRVTGSLFTPSHSEKIKNDWREFSSSSINTSPLSLNIDTTSNNYISQSNELLNHNITKHFQPVTDALFTGSHPGEEIRNDCQQSSSISVKPSLLPLNIDTVSSNCNISQSNDLDLNDEKAQLSPLTALKLKFSFSISKDSINSSSQNDLQQQSNNSSQPIKGEFDKYTLKRSLKYGEDTTTCEQDQSLTMNSNDCSDSSLHFDDTLEEMKMLLKEGYNLTKDTKDNISPNKFESNEEENRNDIDINQECSSNQHYLTTPRVECVKQSPPEKSNSQPTSAKKKNFNKCLKYNYVESPIARYIKSTTPTPKKFKTPQIKTPLSVAQHPTPNYKNVIAPLRVYIKNPSVCLMQNVRSNDVSSLEIQGEKACTNITEEDTDKENELPFATYRPAKKIYIPVENKIKLPPSIQKLVNEPTIEIREKKIKKGSLNGTKIRNKLLNEDLTYNGDGESTVNDDISYIITEQAYIT